MKSLQQYIYEGRKKDVEEDTFTTKVERQLIDELKAHPLKDFWKPTKVLGFNVQRVHAKDASANGWGIVNMGDEYDDLAHVEAKGLPNEKLYLQINRKQNTHWLKDSGETYMVWK